MHNNRIIEFIQMIMWILVIIYKKVLIQPQIKQSKIQKNKLFKFTNNNHFPIIIQAMEQTAQGNLHFKTKIIIVVKWFQWINKYLHNSNSQIN